MANEELPTHKRYVLGGSLVFSRKKNKQMGVCMYLYAQGVDFVNTKARAPDATSYSWFLFTVTVTTSRLRTAPPSLSSNLCT